MCNQDSGAPQVSDYIATTLPSTYSLGRLRDAVYAAANAIAALLAARSVSWSSAT